MSVLSDAEQRDVEQWPAASQRISAVEALKRRLVGDARLVRRQAFLRHHMDIVVGNGDPRNESIARHSIIAGGMAVRHEPFVAPEPVRTAPWKARRKRRIGKTLIETPGRRAAGEAYC